MILCNFAAFYLISELCEPYSEQACLDAAKREGLKTGGLGAAFSGNYDPKGCYAYRSGRFGGIAYFGTGGSIEEMQEKSLNSPRYRPKGFDCKQ